MVILMATLAFAGIGSAGVQDPALAALLDEHWDAYLESSPVTATQLGDHRFDDQLDDNSPQARAAWDARRASWLARAAAIQPANPEDQLSLRLFVDDQATAAAVDHDCDLPTWSVSARDNALIMVNGLAESHPIENAEDAANFLARARALPGYVDQATANLTIGLAKGKVANAASVRIVIDQVSGEIAKPPADWGLRTAGAALPDGERAHFQAALDEVIRAEIAPALERYVALLRTEILPVARPVDREGVGALPGGDRCYAALVRRHTSLDKTPEEIHATGLAELERIHKEMRKLGKKLFGTRDLATIFARLRSDPALHFTTSDEVEAKASEALARAKAAIPRFFGRLPRADCVVARIPAHEAPYTTIAYYWPSVPGGEKPGQYFINTYAPETRPTYEAEALAWHESIPGHHLQIAIAQELPEMPAFRKNAYVTAYSEGWALYTERLADEMGLYSGDLDRMGMLSFDTWRASRLVVDTGMHAMGWTREQAVHFMLANTALAENNIRNEVDRYLTDPGQALAYKLGQLEILRLRKDAEKRLGKRFDLKAFHDVVLDGGPMTLAALDQRVEDWIKARS